MDKIKQALNHPNILGAGAKKRKALNLTPKQKFEVVLKEYKRGTLYSGSGEIVNSYKQALAIAFSESRRNRK